MSLTTLALESNFVCVDYDNTGCGVFKEYIIRKVLRLVAVARSVERYDEIESDDRSPLVWHRF